MPTVRLPLVGVANPRSIDGQATVAAGYDQRFVNVIFDAIKNPITGKTTLYIEKRPGWVTSQLVEAGSPSTGLIKTDILGRVVSAFGETNSTIYDSQTSVGAITGRAIHFLETILGTTGYVLIRSSDGTGWYYASDAATQLTYTGKVTSGGVQVDAIASTAGMYHGQAVTSANMAGGSRVSTVISTSQINLTLAATGSATEAITKTPIAKILSANFVATGTNKSAFNEMDGFIFYCTEDGYLYNSDLNSIHVFEASNKIAVNMAPDLPITVARHKNWIIVFGNSSTEFFYNAGNAAGSPLNRSAQYFKRVGSQNQRSVVGLEDDIYFVSSSRDGDTKVERLRGMGLEKISTAATDKIIGTANATGSNIYANAFNLGGYSYLTLSLVSAEEESLLKLEDDFYVLQENGDQIILEFSASTPTNLSRLLVCNITLNIWCEWTGTLATFVKGPGAGSVNNIIATSRIDTSGKIYSINPSADAEVYADDGAPYSMIIQTSKLDFGTDRKIFIQSITLNGDVQDSGTALLEASDDDYRTWKTMGTFDLTQKVQNITRCGSYKGAGGRAFKLTHTANAAFRAQSLDITYTVGV
ncbi:MAG: hypothetical protein Q7N50_02855 [Armatimonadota bacterium]|nr:hypothetical protein [Armatimonadota bacterium]